MPSEKIRGGDVDRENKKLKWKKDIKEESEETFDDKESGACTACCIDVHC